MLGALLVVAALAPAATAQARDFSIERFAVTLEVHADGSLAVREAITFAFRGSHRGVWRAIPVRHTRMGLEWAMRLDAITVLDEALRPLRSEVTRPGRYVRVKAWVPGAVDTQKTVTILYRVRRGLLRLDDHDELYWNVTGDEWDVPIREAEAVVAPPPGVSLASVRANAYTGPRGATGADFAESRGDNLLTLRATRPLGPREGLTIAVAWPPGAVGRPSVAREVTWFAADNWPLGLPLIACLGVFLAWRTYGVDPAVGQSVKPEYAPPPGLGPAEAGTLADEHAEPRDVVATLIDLAVRGYLRVEQVSTAFDETDYAFRRLKRVLGDPDIRPLELFVLAKLFGQDWNVNMRLLSEVRRDYDNVFPPIRDEIYRSMVNEGLFATSPQRVRSAWAAGGVGLAAAGVAALAMAPPWLPTSPAIAAAGLIVSGLVLLVFSRAMPRRTWKGARSLVHVRGFQEFLERAEKDRLARMPPDTLHRWLPWALALGVSERWIWAFDGLAVEPPAWYGGPERFTLRGYDASVRRFGERVEQAILTTRRSGAAGSGGSGFSGGSSGGGRGGGGGGTF